MSIQVQRGEVWVQEVYYCMLQGRPRVTVFFSDQDKHDFIKAMTETKRRSQMKVYAFALLESQVHIVVSAPFRGLPQLLHTLREVYAAYFSKRNGRDGNVFLESYCERLCYTDRRLLQIIRYVHYLPVTFGHTHHPNLTRFTSHAAYLGDTRYPFVDSDEVLALISHDRAEARRQYQTLSSTAVSASELAQVFKPLVPDVPKATTTPPTLDEIASAVSQTKGVSLRVMQGKGRSAQAVAARRMLIATAVTEHHYPVTEVAEFLCVHHSYVSRLTFGKGPSA
ncbi:MAG: hypothetical protein DDT20_00910 [Firmicutes bacterium]|nr:hypothetical protein [Bacillota bacterium]